jgi:hypothetical protein
LGWKFLFFLGDKKCRFHPLCNTQDKREQIIIIYTYYMTENNEYDVLQNAIDDDGRIERIDEILEDLEDNETIYEDLVDEYMEEIHRRQRIINRGGNIRQLQDEIAGFFRRRNQFLTSLNILRRQIEYYEQLRNDVIDEIKRSIFNTEGGKRKKKQTKRRK